MTSPPMYKLTPAQRAELRALWNAGATTAEAALEAHRIPGFNATNAPLLQRMEMLRIRDPGGGRRMRYFLTPAGVAEARKPSEARRG